MPVTGNLAALGGLAARIACLSGSVRSTRVSLDQLEVSRRVSFPFQKETFSPRVSRECVVTGLATVNKRS
jgi:hypothetical protein